MGRLKRFFQKLTGLFPSDIPRGGQAFDDYCTKLFSIYNIPDNSSYRHAVAGMIMHLGPTDDKASLSFFAKSIRKAMANEVAYAKIQEFREKQKSEESKESSEPPMEKIAEPVA